MANVTIDTIEEAKADLENREKNIERADKIYKDLSGRKQQGGLGLIRFGSYILVDDDNDRWFCEESNFQVALESTVEKAIDGAFAADDASEYYDYFCQQCPALYSMIGCGKFNYKIKEFREHLAESLTEEQIEEIFELLLIEEEEIEEEEEE